MAPISVGSPNDFFIYLFYLFIYFVVCFFVVIFGAIYLLLCLVIYWDVLVVGTCQDCGVVILVKIYKVVVSCLTNIVFLSKMFLVQLYISISVNQKKEKWHP